ncbi:substrate-binding domain-containing protein [Magnetococcales bacterium HHB-1]
MKTTRANSSLVLALLCLIWTLPAQSADITWLGCGVIKNAFTKELVLEFQKRTGITTMVRGGGALKGIRDVAAGRTDIAGTCRPALDFPEEQNVQLNHVAWDALTLIVPDSNPITSVSSEQVQGMIAGDLRNWKQLGGQDIPIELYARRGALSGVGYMFRVMFFQDKNFIYANAQEVPRSSGLIEILVKKGSGTLGISGAASAHKRRGMRMLALDGVYPSKENIQSGAYPLIRPLYYAIGPHVSKKARQFIQFALSPEGQKIISAEGVVNLKEGHKLAALFRDRFGSEYLAPGVLMTQPTTNP